MKSQCAALLYSEMSSLCDVVLHLTAANAFLGVSLGGGGGQSCLSLIPTFRANPSSAQP